MCINLQRTIRGVAAICGATLAVGGAAALSNSAFAQNPAAPATVAAPAPAAPASTATPWTFQGLFDFYYLYDGNVPKGGTGNVTGYNYDDKASTPSLSLAELNIAKAVPANGGIGFKATLIAGDTADQIVTSAETQESRYKNIQQLYLTFAAKSGAGLDIGKFYTPFGYEVVESNANYNYSRSFIFEDLLPVYHSGIRIYTPSYKGLVLTGYVVKAINNDDEGVYDSNKSDGFIGQLNYTAPSGKYTAIETYGGSHDGPNGSQDKVLLSDTDLTITPTAVDTIGLNYTNRQDAYEGSSSVQDNGYAVYYRRQVTAPYAVALRAEKIFSKGGGTDIHIDSLTATLEDKVTKSLLGRLEFRHDDGTQDEFAGGQNGVPTQNTLSLSGVWTFGP